MTFTTNAVVFCSSNMYLSSEYLKKVYKQLKKFLPFWGRIAEIPAWQVWEQAQRGELTCLNICNSLQQII